MMKVKLLALRGCRPVSRYGVGVGEGEGGGGGYVYWQQERWWSVGQPGQGGEL